MEKLSRFGVVVMGMEKSGWTEGQFEIERVVKEARWADWWDKPLALSEKTSPLLQELPFVFKM